MVLGTTAKYEEIALTLLIEKKQKDFSNDKRKTFDDGLSFQFLKDNVQEYYRLKKLVLNRKEKLISTQKNIFEKCKMIEESFLFDFIDQEYLSENCFNIIDKLKTRKI